MKLGLCLSGGGARGAYQIGALMALKEAGIYDLIEYISGTSIGAANAALIASNDLEVVRDIWFNVPKETLHSTENFFKRIFKERTKIMVNGLYEIDELDKILTKNLDYEKIKKKRVFVTLSNGGPEDSGILELLKKSYRHYFKHDEQVVYSPLWKQDIKDINKQIIASCSIPIVFPPMTIDGKHYYDGGVYDNVPIKPLVNAGCDTIIVVHLEHLLFYSYNSKYKDITFHAIKPTHSLGSRLKFEENQSKIRYQMGYEDAKMYLEEHKII